MLSGDLTMKTKLITIWIPEILYEKMQEGAHNMTQLIIKLLKQYFHISEEELQ